MNVVHTTFEIIFVSNGVLEESAMPNGAFTFLPTGFRNPAFGATIGQPALYELGFNHLVEVRPHNESDQEVSQSR